MSDEEESLAEESEEVVEGESELLHDLGKGLAAGFVGVIPVAVLLLLNNMLGLVPDADPVAILGTMLGTAWPGAGWVVLFAGGTLIGTGFASLDSHVERATDMGEIARGGIFGFILSLVLLILFMGLSGGLGASLAIVVVLTNIIYGVVMGATYSALKPETVAT